MLCWSWSWSWSWSRFVVKSPWEVPTYEDQISKSGREDLALKPFGPRALCTKTTRTWMHMRCAAVNVEVGDTTELLCYAKLCLLLAGRLPRSTIVESRQPHLDYLVLLWHRCRNKCLTITSPPDRALADHNNQHYTVSLSKPFPRCYQLRYHHVVGIDSEYYCSLCVQVNPLARIACYTALKHS